MGDIEKAWEIVRREYGIKNEQELREAIRNMEKIDIGIFVSPPQYPKGHLKGKSNE